eukprot:202843_1
MAMFAKYYHDPQPEILTNQSLPVIRKSILQVSKKCCRRIDFFFGNRFCVCSRDNLRNAIKTQSRHDLMVIYRLIASRNAFSYWFHRHIFNNVISFLSIRDITEFRTMSHCINNMCNLGLNLNHFKRINLEFDTYTKKPFLDATGETIFCDEPSKLSDNHCVIKYLKRNKIKHITSISIQRNLRNTCSWQHLYQYSIQNIALSCDRIPDTNRKCKALANLISSETNTFTFINRINTGVISLDKLADVTSLNHIGRLKIRGLPTYYRGIATFDTFDITAKNVMQYFRSCRKIELQWIKIGLSWIGELFKYLECSGNAMEVQIFDVQVEVDMDIESCKIQIPKCVRLLQTNCCDVDWFISDDNIVVHQDVYAAKQYFTFYAGFI